MTDVRPILVMPELIRHPASYFFAAAQDSGTPDQVRGDGGELTPFSPFVLSEVEGRAADAALGARASTALSTNGS